MTITNGYATLAELKAYITMRGGTTSTDAADDAVLEDLIEAASRDIDGATGRTFYARTETHYFDTPAGRSLLLDDDLLTITTLTNGDATVIAATDYHLLPKNSTPYNEIRIKEGETIYWQLSSTTGGAEFAITVAGTWGFSTTAPDDVKEAVLAMAEAKNAQRTGQVSSGRITLTASGVVIRPDAWPEAAQAVIRKYRKYL